MNKGKKSKEIDIEEMFWKFPNFGDMLTELARLQSSHKKVARKKKTKEKKK